MKLKALVLVSALFAVPAFAADLDLSGLSSSTPLDLTAAQGLVDGVIGTLSAPTAPLDTENAAIIVQTDTANPDVAWIDQTGAQNMAVITQADGMAAPGIAIISQSGTAGFAFINQH